ncbi:helix-hairpin-helix domain-containing protein [Alkalihalobacillus clausii]|uniref:helix-hairpin-helix domain-containing protein n=1 Tax=Shouchella clausii TaxID=79880 RepID=UPI00203BE229|nr:helix-hairpin-helix domain-containing protein [Shouchella clausii]
MKKKKENQRISKFPLTPQVRKSQKLGGFIVSAKLGLTDEQKKKLRKSEINMSTIHTINPIDLAEILEITVEEAQQMVASAQFQRLPSIGPVLAGNLVNLGFLHLNDVKGKSGSELTDLLEQHCGCWVDPCVEDQLRLVVHFAEKPHSNKKWWDFTEERKKYRKEHGYPADRPKKPCNSLMKTKLI